MAIYSYICEGLVKKKVSSSEMKSLMIGKPIPSAYRVSLKELNEATGKIALLVPIKKKIDGFMNYTDDKEYRIQYVSGIIYNSAIATDTILKNPDDVGHTMPIINVIVQYCKPYLISPNANKIIKAFLQERLKVYEVKTAPTKVLGPVTGTDRFLNGKRQEHINAYKKAIDMIP